MTSHAATVRRAGETPSNTNRSVEIGRSRAGRLASNRHSRRSALVYESALESLAGEEAVIEEVAAGVERGNADLARVEQIKRFAVLPVDWLPGGDELTPTMKLKRRPIERKYADEIEELYAD